MSKKRKRKPKTAFFLTCQIVLLSAAALGFIIIGWCGYSMGNPFPYASYIGGSLLFFSLVANAVLDKTKMVKGRHNYPDNMGGDNGCV